MLAALLGFSMCCSLDRKSKGRQFKASSSSSSHSFTTSLWIWWIYHVLFRENLSADVVAGVLWLQPV